MKKKPIVVREDTIFQKGKTYCIPIEDLEDYPPINPLPKKTIVDYAPPKPYFRIIENLRESLPQKTIIDLDFLAQHLINHKIVVLSDISDIINSYMKESPAIKKASVADVTGNSWTEFRKIRRRYLRETNLFYLKQPPDFSNPDTWHTAPTFPLVPISDYGDLSCFRLIRDDCDDIVNFLKEAEKLSPYCLSYLFAEVIFDTESRFYYLIGYHRKKYERGEPARILNADTGEQSKKIAEEVLTAECGGITGYDALPRGKKTHIVEIIAEALHPEAKRKDKDPATRNVNNILNKIRDGQKQNCNP